jgi:cysteine desulfurase
MHTDAAQSIGKIPVNVDDLGVDLLSVAGHKLYAPKGIGVLYMRTGTSIGKLIHGASHERNLRAGTENVLEIAGLGKACVLIAENLASYAEHMKELRDLLETGDYFPIPLGEGQRAFGAALAQYLQHQFPPSWKPT